MEPTYRYPAHLDAETEANAVYQRDLHREVYNHALGQWYKPAPEHDKPSYTQLQNKLPALKREWPRWDNTHSKALQMTIHRIFDAEAALEELDNRGYDVGELKWKNLHEFRSITYNQSGFDVDSNTGRDNHARVRLSEIGWFDITYHRPLPDNKPIKQVILKQEKTGEWYVSIVVDTDDDAYPEKPDPADIDPEDTVGIDLGILSFIHDTDQLAVSPPDVSGDLHRIRRCHQRLSRKEHGSANWEDARQDLAKAYEQLRHKFKDFREKLASDYTREYDAVFLEDLDVRGLLRLPSNGRNIMLMSWRETIETFERHGDKNACHVETVPPEGTTKRCAYCSTEVEKDLWVREHNCPSCGFETDRDQNAAFEVQKLGLEELGVQYALDELLGLGESDERPAETGLPADAFEWNFHEVSAKTVVETGTPLREGGSHGSPDPW